MQLATYTLREYFDHHNTPCLSFHIYRLSDVPFRPNDVMHRSDYFQLLVLQSGEVQKQNDQHHFSLSAGELSLTFPHQVTAFQIQYMQQAEGIVIEFDEMLFCSDLLKNELIAYNDNLMGKLSHVVLDDATFAKINAYALQIQELFSDLSPIKKEQIRFYIKIMLLAIIEAAHRENDGFQTPEHGDAFAKFKTLLEVNFKTQRTVAYYTEALRISAKKLNEICKHKTGQTVLQIIHERILTEIKRMMLFSGKSHKEIAYELNFDSPSALNKFVYAKLKETPSELKQELSRIYKF